jgi:hypothetical protein
MKRITFGLVAVACAIVAPPLASAQTTCPASIAVEQKAAAPGPDWAVSYAPFKSEIAGVTIFEGPPAEQASLAPDDEKKTKDALVQTWKLPKSDRGYWLQCSYANTTAQISRRMPAGVTRCDVGYERDVRFRDGGNVVKSVNCK